jgi:hypothetical protein
MNAIESGGRGHMRTCVRTCLLAFVVAGVFSAAASSFASIGVGTNTGKIALREPVKTGGTYELPTFSVGNTGTSASGYRMRVVPYEDTLTPDTSWVEFEPGAVYLFPGQWARIRVTLRVPPGAKPGRYAALLAAAPEEPGSPAGTRVNIGAGPRLEMDVVAGGPMQAVLYTLARWMPWSAVAGAVALGALFLVSIIWIRRRGGRPAEAEREGTPGTEH